MKSDNFNESDKEKFNIAIDIDEIDMTKIISHFWYTIHILIDCDLDYYIYRATIRRSQCRLICTIWK